MATTKSAVFLKILQHPRITVFIAYGIPIPRFAISDFLHGALASSEQQRHDGGRHPLFKWEQAKGEMADHRLDKFEKRRSVDSNTS
jgi:hypothetical protein